MEIVMRWIVSAAAATAMAGVAYSTPLAGNAPVANDDFGFLDNATGSVVLTPLDNDSDADGDALRIIGVSGPGSEFAQTDGATISLAAPDGFYLLNYTVEDAEGLQSSASILALVITIAPPVCGLVECF
jgi:hypothetical protein